MNYQKIYEQLTAKDMIADYTELHHIVPKCMGGSNDPSNLVRLTPEAHYVAHQLLVKIYPENEKIIYGAVIMTAGKHRNNKMYGWIKRKNSQAKKGKPLSAERIAKIKASLARPEIKAKMRVSKKGKPLSDEHRLKLSQIQKTRIRQPRSPDLDLKRIECPQCNRRVLPDNRRHFDKCKYQKPPAIIKPVVDLVDSKGRSIMKCPHCTTTGIKSTMYRYHFDNCKRKGKPVLITGN